MEKIRIQIHGAAGGGSSGRFPDGDSAAYVTRTTPKTRRTEYFCGFVDGWFGTESRWSEAREEAKAVSLATAGALARAFRPFFGEVDVIPAIHDS